MFLSQTIQTDVVTITPDIAKKLLGQNTKNRNISVTNYNKISEAMISGEWELNGEAIKIAQNGRILDGQHRLMAAADNNLSFTTLVVYGLKDETQATMDSGKSRSASDVLRINGYTNSKQIAAIATALIRKERWNLRAAVTGGRSYPVTTKQVLDKVENEPSIIELAKLTHRMSSIGLPGRITGVLYHTFSDIDQEDADDFFEKLETGAMLKDGDPILTLRNLLITLKTKEHGTRDQAYIMAVTIKAWNKYRDGQQAQLIKFTPGGKNPEKFPEPH